MALTADLKSYATTGSISAASKTLTIANNPGFEIGHHIIVEIGTESGGGLRGTIGVGGSWPMLNYANAIARSADNSQANNTFAWQLDDGSIWRYVSGSWVTFNSIYGLSSVHYYFQKAVPRSLCTTITDMSGTGNTTLTLNDAASADAVDANVYYDNSFYWNGDGNGVGICGPNASDPDQKTIILPSGTFAFGDPPRVQDHDGWTIQGAGIDQTIILTPKGVGSGFKVTSCPNITISDFTFLSNLGNDGFGWSYDITKAVPDRIVTELKFGGSGNNAYIANGFGVYVVLNSNNSTLRRLKVVNAMTSALAFDNNSNYSNMYDCVAYQHVQELQYLQWQMNISSSHDCSMVDCAFYGDTYWSAMEIFGNSSGQIGNNKLIRPKVVNGVISVNSANNWQLIDPEVTFTANALPASGWVILANSPININFNTEGNVVSDGGQVLRPQLIFEGLEDPSTNDMPNMIGVSSGLVNVSILGTYPNACNPKGLLQMPDYVAGPGLRKAHIENHSTNLIVSGIRFVGTQPASQCITQTGDLVENCVVDQVTGGGTQDPSNQTNAAYAISYPTWYAANCVGGPCYFPRKRFMLHPV